MAISRLLLPQDTQPGLMMNGDDTNLMHLHLNTFAHNTQSPPFEHGFDTCCSIRDVLFLNLIYVPAEINIIYWNNHGFILDQWTYDGQQLSLSLVTEPCQVGLNLLSSIPEHNCKHFYAFTPFWWLTGLPWPMAHFVSKKTFVIYHLRIFPQGGIHVFQHMFLPFT